VPHSFSFDESDLAAVFDSSVVALFEVGCGDLKYSGGTASGTGSSDILRYLISVPAYVVSISEGCSGLLAAFLFRRLKSQHIVPTVTTTQTIETVIPIRTERLWAADGARLLREGAACNIAERTAKAMGAILTV
jgi:hypothetical protein